MTRNTVFKAKVALAALEADADWARIARRYGVALSDIEDWTRQFHAAERQWSQKTARRDWL